MNEGKRPSVRVSFKYNKETGEIEDFIIDDSSPAASEEYHDNVAKAISGYFGRRAEIEDAGPLRVAANAPGRLGDTPAVDDEGTQEVGEENA